jgi:hypothetical protein
MTGIKVKHLLLEPGIIKILVQENAVLDIKDVLEMRTKNLELSKGDRFCVLLNTTKGYFSMNPEALKMLASKEYLETRKATAIVVNSLAARLAGNFFKRLHSSDSSTRLFNSEEEALLWLRSF